MNLLAPSLGDVGGSSCDQYGGAFKPQKIVGSEQRRIATVQCKIDTAMSDSESEESADEIARMIDAADPQFANLFNKKTPLDKSYQASKDRGINFQDVPATSFRNQINNDTYDNLGTTLEFRHHVARKLSDIIDRKIKLVKDCKEVIHPPTSNLTTSDGGVHLFATSVSCIDVQNKDDAINQRKPITKRKRKKSAENSSSSDELEKLASVAVSGEWVLSKKGLYGENDKESHTVDCDVSTKTLASPETGTSTVQHSNVCRKKKKKKRKQHGGVNYELTSMAVASECALSNEGLHSENDKKTPREGIIDNERCDEGFDASTKALTSAENGMGNAHHRNVCGKKKKRDKGCNSQQVMENNCTVNLQL